MCHRGCILEALRRVFNKTTTVMELLTSKTSCEGSHADSEFQASQHLDDAADGNAWNPDACQLGNLTIVPFLKELTLK